MPPLRYSMDANTSSNLLIPRALPLENVKTWSQNVDFEIDALGLVTLLGADEVNLTVGTLQRRRYTEYLPLLAAFVISGNRFTAGQPGFVLYNLSDGMSTTELKGWFTRWLMNQKINNATTVLEWKKRDSKAQSVSWIAFALSILLVTPLLVCTILMGDWYGVGNSAAIIVSIFTRTYLLTKLRQARNSQIREKQQTTASSDPLEEEKPARPPEETALKELCVVRSDGKMVTIKVPAEVLPTFIKSCKVTNERIYNGVRRVGWVALGAHMCILGMCTLFTQIYTVVLLVLSTWALSTGFDSDLQHKVLETKGEGDFAYREVESPFNKDWNVIKTDHPKYQQSTKPNGKPIDCDRRQVAWARLKPDESPDGPMKRWNLFPHESNRKWWQDYQEVKATLNPSLSATDTQSLDPQSPSSNNIAAFNTGSATAGSQSLDSQSPPSNDRPILGTTNSTTPLLPEPTNQSTPDGRSLTSEASSGSSSGNSGVGDAAQTAVHSSI